MDSKRSSSSTVSNKPATANSSSPANAQSGSSSSIASAVDSKSPSAARPLYSSKLSDAKARAPGSSSSKSSSPTTRQPPVPQQKAWTSAKSPITGRTNTPQQNPLDATNKNSVVASLREGQRVLLTLANGAEYEGVYASNSSDSASCILRMVQQKNGPSDSANGNTKREQSNMSFARKDITDARVVSGNANKLDGKAQNGNRSSFRTDRDTANANRRFGGERELQRWQPDTPDAADGGLEGGLQGSKQSHGAWDQFAENERLFGLKTDYDESIYTTTIDKNHPQYKQRIAAAERKAREIERSVAATSHVAEERVMDFVGGDDNGDEEDKYSGVKRQQQDFPPLGNRENKYTPPARRAPAAASNVKGAPVDPAIISSQIKGVTTTKQPSSKAEETKAPVPAPSKTPVPQNTDKNASTDSKQDAKSAESKAADNKPADTKSGESKAGDKPAGGLRPSATTGRAISPQGKDAGAVPSATSTVERDVLNSFKNFATQQRLNAEKARSNKAKADKEVKLIELKKFADSFKLSTPVPSDLISIIAKDPAKQKQIQAKALQNAEDVAKAKESSKDKPDTVAKDVPAKPAAQQTPTPPATTAPAAATAATRPVAPQHTSSPSGVPNRHPGPRQPYNGQQQYSNRNGRSPGQNMPPHYQQTGNLAQRLRNVEQQKLSQPPNHHVPQEVRLPPTGPANAVDPYGNRRLSGLAPAHLGPKLNPNTQEFRPSAFAQPFNPVGPSGASSPRSSVNNAVEAQSTATPVVGQLIRRKTKAIDVKKCFILSHIQTLQPPHNNRTWEENGGLRPSFDTIPTWKQLMEDEPADSIMRLNYAQYFERQPFSGATLATPNPPHVVPQMAHQHQLPFHLQHGAHSLAPRQSPHMPPMQMHTGQPGHAPHAPFNGDDHRMMHSNSAQSFASPRMTQVPMAAYPPAMNSPAQMPYNQPVMQPFMGPGTPQMNQFRNFSQNPQFMPQQPGHMSTPLMVPQQYMAGPAPMVTAAPQMQMYPGGHPQFMPPGPTPPQPMPGTNGYPSPGRPAAPMMVHQGSQQGQPMYGMSPGMQYQQPVFTPQQPGQMSNMRGYSNPGPQQYGTSPQQMHQFGPQHRSGSYGGKGFQHGGQNQGPSPAHAAPTGPQGRAPDSQEEAK